MKMVLAIFVSVVMMLALASCDGALAEIPETQELPEFSEHENSEAFLMG